MVVVEDQVTPKILEALAPASDLNLMKVQVVTDCVATVHHLKRLYLGESSRIIEDIKEKMKDFEICLFDHERREKNWESHSLARASVTFNLGRHLWLMSPPEFVCIEPLIALE